MLNYVENILMLGRFEFLTLFLIILESVLLIFLIETTSLFIVSFWIFKISGFVEEEETKIMLLY